MVSEASVNSLTKAESLSSKSKIIQSSSPAGPAAKPSRVICICNFNFLIFNFSLKTARISYKFILFTGHLNQLQKCRTYYYPDLENSPASIYRERQISAMPSARRAREFFRLFGRNFPLQSSRQTHLFRFLKAESAQVALGFR